MIVLKSQQPRPPTGHVLQQGREASQSWFCSPDKAAASSKQCAFAAPTVLVSCIEMDIVAGAVMVSHQPGLPPTCLKAWLNASRRKMQCLNTPQIKIASRLLTGSHHMLLMTCYKHKQQEHAARQLHCTCCSASTSDGQLCSEIDRP